MKKSETIHRLIPGRFIQRGERPLPIRVGLYIKHYRAKTRHEGRGRIVWTDNVISADRSGANPRKPASSDGAETRPSSTLGRVGIARSANPFALPYLLLRSCAVNDDPYHPTLCRWIYNEDTSSAGFCPSIS